MVSQNKKLLLIRHAEAEFGFFDDFERPLNHYGRLSLPETKEWLKEQGYVPDKVLVSTALRTQETAKGIFDVPLTSSDALYYSSVKKIIEEIAMTEESVNCLAVVGHMSVIGAIAHRFDPNSHFNVPPLGINVLEVYCDWSEFVNTPDTKFLEFHKPSE
ncbi:MAG: hypothetical protein QM613_00130 [Micrococcaceae bacterium]